MSRKARQHEQDERREAIPIEEGAEEAGEREAGEESLEAKVERLEGEVADLDAKWKRAMADAQNVRRQSRLNESEAAYQGARRVLENIIPVIDHFDLALGQDPGSVSAEQIIGGVRLIRDELLKALASQNVTLIEPEPGDEFDPNRHEAMMRQASGEVEPGSVLRALQVGYAMGERVLRPAKVIIAEGAASEQDQEGQA